MHKISEMIVRFETLPQAELGTVLEGEIPLILAPHPDDETLGCGGLIAAVCATGIPPVVVILTDGSASHPNSRMFPPSTLAKRRERETLQATQLLGLPKQNLFFFRQPDTKLVRKGPEFNRIVRRAAAIGRKHGCGLVVGPWAGDPHCDHEAAARIAAAVAESGQWRLLSYPVWGWLRDPEALVDEPRQGGWRLNISGFSSLKAQAIAAHASQYGDLITDAPEGFRLPKNLLSIFARPYEVFIDDQRFP